MDFNDVLARVKKLLNMASDVSSPEEAAIAANRASKLMRQYDLTMADVIANDIAESHKDILSEPISNAEYVYSHYPLWMQWLSCGLSTRFNCHSKFQFSSNNSKKVKMNVFGYSSDVAILKYLFSYLTYQLNKLADEYCSQFKNELPHQTITKNRKEYLCGAVSAVLFKVDELYSKDDEILPTTSSGMSLMIIKKQAIEEKYGVFNYNESDFDTPIVRQGYTDASEKIHINKVIDSEDESIELLLKQG